MVGGPLLSVGLVLRAVATQAAVDEVLDYVIYIPLNPKP